MRGLISIKLGVDICLGASVHPWHFHPPCSNYMVNLCLQSFFAFSKMFYDFVTSSFRASSLLSLHSLFCWALKAAISFSTCHDGDGDLLVHHHHHHLLALLLILFLLPPPLKPLHGDELIFSSVHVQLQLRHHVTGKGNCNRNPYGSKRMVQLHLFS